RVRARRRPQRHRRDPQLRRRRHLRPRGEPEDLPRAARPLGAPEPRGARRAARRDAGRGRRAGAEEQRQAVAGDKPGAAGGRRRPGAVRLAAGLPRRVRRPRPRRRVPAHRPAARRAPRRGRDVHAPRARGDARLREDGPLPAPARDRRARRPAARALPDRVLPYRPAGAPPGRDRRPLAAARDHGDAGDERDRRPPGHGVRAPRGAAERRHPVEVVRAALVAMELLGTLAFAEDLHARDDALPPEAAYSALRAMAQAVEGVVAWLLASDLGRRPLSEVVAEYGEPLATLRRDLERFLPAAEKRRFRASVKQHVKAGHDEPSAERVAGLEYVPASVGVVDAARAAGVALEVAATAFFALGERLSLGVLRDALRALPTQGTWEKIAQTGI